MGGVAVPIVAGYAANKLLGDPVGKALKGVGGALGLGSPSTGGLNQFGLTRDALLGEKEALQRFRDIGAGKTPSVSEMQFQKAMQDVSKQQLSAAASARGMSNAGLAQREAMQAGKEAGIDFGAQSAIAKEQEMRGASEMLLRQAAAQRGAALEAEQSKLQAQQQANATRANFFGNLAGAAATIAAASSDVSLKENMNQTEKSGSEMVGEFLDALKSYTYNYKDKENNGQKNPEGKVTSVMAQDLEKSKLGKQMVVDGPEGKMVDYGQGMAPLFAAIAELNQRTKKLEKKG